MRYNKKNKKLLTRQTKKSSLFSMDFKYWNLSEAKYHSRYRVYMFKTLAVEKVRAARK